MTHFTSNTYQMKREILNFSNKISRRLPRPDRKFTADMTYGILVSGNCLLTDIVLQNAETQDYYQEMMPIAPLAFLQLYGKSDVKPPICHIELILMVKINMPF